MNIDYTVTALMFPAIPLLMSVYGNRFHTLSNLIRKIHSYSYAVHNRTDKIIEATLDLTKSKKLYFNLDGSTISKAS